jgi:hypothetical protein
MMEKCSHPPSTKCEDDLCSPEFESGAKSLYQTSINAKHPDSWKWLSPHVRNRWRWRFEQALIAYQTKKGQQNEH